jgi:anthranilate phosphoribosyltransferase
MIQEAIAALLDGKDLDRERARQVMDDIMKGEAAPAQIAGFLIALRAKGETADEIAGSAEAMRDHALTVSPHRRDVIDTAGTGGDGKGTINISTTAGLVAAAAGASVAKHGNRAVSSKSGSADVLEALGFDIDPGPERVSASIDGLGFGFLFAPSHHPAMKHAGPVRKELGVRTVFNVLGPLTNPAGARSQLLGVYAESLVPVIADVLVRLRARRAIVVHGAGGIDELSPAGPNWVVEVDGDEVRRTVIDPEALGVERCDPEALSGGSPKENAEDIRRIMAGEPGPKRDAVLLNAAAAMLVSGRVADLAEGLEAVREAVDSGGAAERLEDLIAFSRSGEPAAV